MTNYYQHNGTNYVHVSDYAALEARLAEVAANAPWLTQAHILCSDHGIPPGNISDRLSLLRIRLAELPEKLAEAEAERDALLETQRKFAGLPRGDRAMTDIVERARLVQRVNAHWLDSICDCDECTEERFDLITPMADEIEALRARLAHAEACLAEKHLRLAEVEALLKRAVECLGDNDDEDVLARAINKLLYSERHINADSASVTQEKNP